MDNLDVEEASRIRELVKGSIDLLKTARTDAINWASVRCYECARLEDGRWLVRIEEAGPESHAFAELIRRLLKADGYDTIVHLEW